MIQTRYIGRIGEVRISSDEGSNRVTIEVAGKSAELTAANARAIVIKLQSALRTAQSA